MRTSITNEGGGTHEGNYKITSSQDITYSKIHGDLIFKTSGITVSISKNLYVTGNIIFENPNQTLQLSSSLGENSKIVLADGKMDMKNNATIQGSGHAKSFIMMLSGNNSLNENNPAIYASNNGSSAIFVAPNGLIRVYNGNVLHNATGYKVKLDNNAQVIYDHNLQYFSFNPTPNQPTSVDASTWEEL